ncbi:deaminase [Brevibacillus panacihumi W25]|uniref:Deaminase n=1 Tax=Brevibacillus panacihumi W25 TaxID=1408254 RepID=V6LZL2_9BACL|nr:deaminase [Brevibacillus panacihumi]EST51577.1 deaminase [Brevibacillus panacihumi W25]
MNQRDIKSFERLKERFKINMEFAIRIGQLSTCDRAQVGAVLYDPKKKSIKSMGYNSSLSGHPHCDEVGHLMVDNHCLRSIHAEINCLLDVQDAADCILFVTHFPCINCAKVIIKKGIIGVVYLDSYRKREETVSILEEAKINIALFEEVVINPVEYMEKFGNSALISR